MYHEFENVTNDNNIEKWKPGRKRCKKKKRQGTLIQQSINFDTSRRAPAGIHHEQDFGDSFEEPKRDGFIRIAGGNIDNFTTKNFNNEKGNLLRAFIRRYELDGFWGQEAGLNWDLMPHSGKLESMFRSKNALYSVTAHNKHRTNSRKQYGGTFAMAFGELATKATNSGVDLTGLGRWSWIQFSGKEGHTTRILSVYQPCHTSRVDTDRVYAQHLEYFRARRCFQCPRKKLIEDLEALILSWKGNGIRVLVFMDANKNMTNGHMQRMLSSEVIGMQPVTIKNHPDLPLTATHMRGSQPGRVPVDKVWATNDLPVDMAGWLAFHKCPGDHRIIMIEINTEVLLGDELLRITRPPARRLSCQIPRAKKNYQRRIISHFQQHKVLERLHRVYATLTTSLSTDQEQEME